MGKLASIKDPTFSPDLRERIASMRLVRQRVKVEFASMVTLGLYNEGTSGH